MATKKNIEIDLDLNDRNAKKRIKDLNKELGNTEDSLEDAESAGKTMARSIERAADDMKSEIDDTARAVDALERAFDDSDYDATQSVSDLKRLGLTAEDIEQDADALAAALKEAGTVSTHATAAGFDDVDQALGRVDEGTGRAKDTMHGFVGGAVGELPLVGDAMGPVAEGLGQLTEGALSGEIALSDMAKVAGPMAGITAVVMGITKALESKKRVEEWNAQKVDDYRDALLEVNDEAEAYLSTLDKTEQITANTGGAFGFFEDEENIMDDLVDAGINAELWTEALTGNAAAQDEVRERLEALIETHRVNRDAQEQMGEEYIASQKAMDNAQDALDGYDQALDNNAQAVEEAADHEAFYGDTLEDTEEAYDGVVTAAEERIDVLAEELDAQEAITEALLDGAEVMYDLEDAQWAMTDAVQEGIDVYADAESTARDKAEADRGVAEAAEAVADAEVAKARQTAAAAGETIDAADEIDIYNRSLIRQAGTLSGTQRQAILNHIRLVNDIPEAKMTAIETAIEQGDYDLAERLLNGVSRTRQAAVEARIDQAAFYKAERELAWLERNRTAYYQTQRIGAHPSSIYSSAKGTPYSAGGLTLVGEEGPEVVDMPQGAAVTDAQASKGRMNRMGGSGGNTGRSGGDTYITNNFPAGVRPTDVTQASRRYKNVQGPV